MKKIKREYTAKALKDLADLNKSTAERIIKKIRFYSESGDPLSSAKSLAGNFSGLYRYRIGDYRVIFSIDSKGTVTIMNILRIKHRKDIYRTDI